MWIAFQSETCAFYISNLTQRFIAVRSSFFVDRKSMYSGRKITPSLGYVTKDGKERWKGQGVARQQRVCLSMYSVNENIFPLLISTQSAAFWFTDFHITLYFVNQRNYKTLAMQAHVFTRTRYFYNLNVIISHPIVYKEGLGYLFVCAIASRSSPSPTCVFVTVIQAWSYFASAVVSVFTFQVYSLQFTVYSLPTRLNWVTDAVLSVEFIETLMKYTFKNSV
jgi:hypothetical protein